jgi:prolipoprotein diacylglyceryltransferase
VTAPGRVADELAIRGLGVHPVINEEDACNPMLPCRRRLRPATDLPWGIAFPDGLPPTTVPVHPTQIYEALALVPLAVLLFSWRRRERADAFVLSAYLLVAGAIRFAIEFLRVNERVVGPFSVAHLASMGVIFLGLASVLRWGRPLSTKHTIA